MRSLLFRSASRGWRDTKLELFAATSQSAQKANPCNCSTQTMRRDQMPTSKGQQAQAFKFKHALRLLVWADTVLLVQTVPFVISMQIYSPADAVHRAEASSFRGWRKVVAN